ncbi:hypothetical protein LTR36_006879 [Oleoguttula mirabilis]|uniref:G-protein coupled receptors family 2 profile 2 domain-containing protein n=1 Tax=Oleoguttula mirabilis TaxID=1507867 RepID=A0AAV9JB85_9PEZI|nr:hypothetical protein LTR36_006879 [Oleoguttula mirabilis]
MAEGLNATICPTPFLLASNYPATGGELSGRFCANIADGLTCCLPCPITEWVFKDEFKSQAPVANYISIVSFVCNILLLLTFLVLAEEQSHRHYLSVGVTVSLLMLSLAFIIPLGTKPELCHNDITPNNMYTDVGCAWTGALLLAGAMGAVVWILLRSIWTALRIIFDFKRTDIFKWVSLALGVGLPALFLAVEMPVTGVSYRLGDVCIPNGRAAFVTWFVWLLAFATLSAIILIATIIYCLWKYALSALAGSHVNTHRSTKSVDSAVSGEAEPGQQPSRRAIRRRKRVEWARIKRVLYLQWRTILLAFIVVNETIFFALIFVQQTAAAEAAARGITEADAAWAACLVSTQGDKNACLDLSTGLGLSEPRVIATLLLASLLGPVVFLLMLRWSMFTGWYDLLRNPRQFLKLFHGRRPSVGSQDFIMQSSPKHMSLTRPLGSEESRKQDGVVGTKAEPKIDAALSETEEHDEHDRHDLESATTKEKEKDEAEIMV